MIQSLTRGGRKVTPRFVMQPDPFDDQSLRPLLHVKLWRQISITAVPGQRWEDACWIWQGHKHRNREDPDQFEGHGQMQFRGKNYLTHRLAYELFAGRKVDPALVIRHKCDRSLCCNPAHLETGTPMDNVMDRVTRRRSATGLRNGAHTKPESRPRGEKHRDSTITEAQAALIKGACMAMGDGYGVGPAIAKHFDVTLPVVRGIRNNESWVHVIPVTPDPLPPFIPRGSSDRLKVPTGNRTLTEELVIELRKRYHTDQFNKYIVGELSKEFKVSRNTVTKVLQCETWNHVETSYEPMPKGGHGMLVLTVHAIQTIRATLAAHPTLLGVGVRLAARFGVTPTTITRIGKRIQQPHIPDDPTKALSREELNTGCSAPVG